MKAKTKKQIIAEATKVETRVWYNRCYRAIITGVEAGTERRPPDDIWEGMLAAARKAEQDDQDVALEELNDRELGRLEGQMYALRWVLGDESLGMDT
jgi:hypothetical protein